jgi:hypothetical protein
MIESLQGGNLGDPGGNEMESEEKKEGSPTGLDYKHKNNRERVLVVANIFQEIRIPVKSDVPARDTRTNQAYAYNVRWTSKLIFFSLIATINNVVYQQNNNNESRKIKFLKGQ